ncbi:N-hydroxyarylamine O-acetyltransferase [Lentzea sp. NBRC 105346]|uniref:arylamine N-acetyltransferase family protein n=1 Tax=Lentzea sp. NBRC 105346 TaxID=3032205 RepID=UPI0024A02E34|nr:arylamine N-acetyltransferase [Lentzea sp. NBRC 105346]GLZ32431.1 N-hydroxyarylamine O-acetyltransferase [Lentzea sp. NBRC 105346]
MDAYLARIGATRDSSLAELQERHLLTVPFENLDIHLGTRIVLDESLLLEKVVGRRRGGFCYELNGAFAALLRSLGHDVKLLACRVFLPDRIGAPLDHVALQVDDVWLCDVGFGRFAMRPLRLDSREDQVDPSGVFRLHDTEDGDIDVHQNGEPQYRLEPRERTLDQFIPTCWWMQTAPESHFLKEPMCTIALPDGRITFAGTKLIRTSGDSREETPVDDVPAVLRKYFGVELPHTDFRQKSASGLLPEPTLPV